MNSILFRLNFRDFGKGAVVAVLVVLLKFFLDLITGGGLDTLADPAQWGIALDLAVKAGAAYLLKNLFSDEEGKIGGRL